MGRDRTHHIAQLVKHTKYKIYIDRNYKSLTDRIDMIYVANIDMNDKSLTERIDDNYVANIDMNYVVYKSLTDHIDMNYVANKSPKNPQNK